MGEKEAGPSTARLNIEVYQKIWGIYLRVSIQPEARRLARKWSRKRTVMADKILA